MGQKGIDKRQNEALLFLRGYAMMNRIFALYVSGQGSSQVRSKGFFLLYFWVKGDGKVVETCRKCNKQFLAEVNFSEPPHIFVNVEKL